MILNYDNEKGLLRLTIEEDEVRRTHCRICHGPIDPHTAQYSDKCMGCLKELQSLYDDLIEYYKEMI